MQMAKTMKMRIQLDEEKIRREGIYNYDKIIKLLDETFEELEIYREEDVDGILAYSGTGNPRDFGRFGLMYNSLKRKAWFIDNALLWELHEPLDFYGIEEDNIEDLLTAWKETLKMEA